MFEKNTEGKNMLFASNLLINRFIKAYLNRAESRQYLRLLFGKTLDRLAKIEGPAPMPLLVDTQDVEEVPLRHGGTLRGEMDPRAKLVESAPQPGLADTVRSGSLRLLDDLHDESKQPEGIVTELVCKDCDELLRRIRKNLVYMPLSVRYLCKLTANIAISCVSYPYPLLLVCAGGEVR
jgi:hypothetical protein